LNEDQKNLELQLVEIEDNLKTVELLLKTRNSELSEQQSKYDKLMFDKKQKQEQLDEVVKKLNDLIETKNTYSHDISIIREVLPQLEREEDTRKQNLDTLITKQKETEAQISKFFLRN